MEPSRDFNTFSQYFSRKSFDTSIFLNLSDCSLNVNGLKLQPLLGKHVHTPEPGACTESYRRGQTHGKGLFSQNHNLSICNALKPEIHCQPI